MKNSNGILVFFVCSIIAGFLLSEFVPVGLKIDFIPEKFQYFFIFHIAYALAVSLLAFFMLNKISNTRIALLLLLPLLIFPLLMSIWLIFFMFSNEIKSSQKLDAIFESFFVNLVYWLIAIFAHWFLRWSKTNMRKIS